MNKVLLFISLILISCFSAQRLPNNREQNARDFISGFFNTLNGNFTLDENCVGQKTKENINDLIDSFHNKKVFKIFEDLKSIVEITENTCPIQESINYVEQKYSAIKEGYYFQNFEKNWLKILEIVVHEFNRKPRTAYAIGSACGNIEKLTIFKPQNYGQLNFLALQTTEMPKFDFDFDFDFDMDLEGFKQYFKGVLTGVSSVSFDKNVCYTSTVDIKIEEVKAIFELLYKSIKERSASEFYDAVMQILEILGKLKDANEHCNISGLIKSIGVYATPYAGIAKLIYNIASHYSTYYEDIKATYHAFANKEWENAGVHTGSIVSTLLGWHTS